MVDASEKSPMVSLIRPPTCGSTSCGPMNHDEMPGPVAMASHTCSGVASSSTSFRSSNSLGISGLLPWSGARLGIRLGTGPDAWMQGEDQTVAAAAPGLLVVVLGDQLGDGAGQLLRERSPVGGGREPYLGLQGE